MTAKQMHVSSPPQPSTIFDDVYRTIVQKLSFLIIPAINEAFGTHYDINTDFAQLRNEHLELAGKIITDSIFHIGNKLYHMECQSTPDSSMVIRMFEYDSAIALEAAYQSGPPYCVKYPLSAVIYLRSGKDTTDSISMQVKFPNQQTLTYEVPVIHVQKYSLDDISLKNLWLYVPFYLMRYEKYFTELETDNTKRKAMLDELQELLAKLDNFTTATNHISSYSDIVNLAQRISNYLLKEHPKIKKEVNRIMGGKILELHSEKMFKKGKAEERKSAIRTLIISLKDLSIDQSKVVEQVMKRYSLTRKQAQAAVQANW